MNKIALVGEAYGKDEEAVGQPFVGASGRILNSLLHTVGINRTECLVTNVFNLRPKPTNDVKNLCGSRSDGIPGWPALAPGKFARREYEGELSRLFAELTAFAPTIIIALGATAAWALAKQTIQITKVRGSPFLSHFGFKVLPTYHPAAVMREFSLRPVVWADLTKAKAEAEYPELRLPRRELWLSPTLADMQEFLGKHILPSPELSVDIETKGNQMTCIGFAPTPFVSLVVPFYTQAQPDGNYWRTLDEELAALAWVRRVLTLPKRVLFQNGLFDMHHLLRTYHIPVPGAADDTMLLHHALQPELRKSLGFLGSIYSNEPSWKHLGKSAKKEDQD